MKTLFVNRVITSFQLVSTFLKQEKLIIDDDALSCTRRQLLQCKWVCLAYGREVHGQGFLSSRGSVIPVMTDPTAARSLVWSLNITSLTAGGFFTTVSVCECKRKRKHLEDLEKKTKQRDAGLWSELKCLYLTTRGQSNTNNTAVTLPTYW